MRHGSQGGACQELPPDMTDGAVTDMPTRTRVMHPDAQQYVAGLEGHDCQ